MLSAGDLGVRLSPFDNRSLIHSQRAVLVDRFYDDGRVGRDVVVLFPVDGRRQMMTYQPGLGVQLRVGHRISRRPYTRVSQTQRFVSGDGAHGLRGFTAQGFDEVEDDVWFLAREDVERCEIRGDVDDLGCMAQAPQARCYAFGRGYCVSLVRTIEGCTMDDGHNELFHCRSYDLANFAGGALVTFRRCLAFDG
ncbi:MAG: hypothetical protein ACWGMY_05940 [Hyphomicrobiaceae bacterium]